MNGKILYFAYGSNLFMEQMAKRCPDSIPYTQGILRDHKLVYKTNFGGRGVADVVKSEGSKVYGAIYEISNRDLKKLDKCEGRPIVYDRHEVFIETRKGMIKCLVYKMEPNFQYGLPNVDYFRKIFTGYADWALPQRSLTSAYKEFKSFIKDMPVVQPTKKSVVNSSKHKAPKSSNKKRSNKTTQKPVYKTRTPIGYEPAIKWKESN